MDCSYVYFSFKGVAPLPVPQLLEFERSGTTCQPGTWCNMTVRIKVDLPGSGWYQADETLVFVEAPDGQQWIMSHGTGIVSGTTVERSLPNLFYPMAGTRLGIRYFPWGRWTAQDATTIYLPFAEPTPELQLTANPSHLEAVSDTVTFTPEAPGAVILEVLNWSWEPSDTAQAPLTVACAPQDNPCVIPVHEPGAMKVTARVDGQVREALASVTLGDSVFDVAVDCGGARPRASQAKCTATINSVAAVRDSIFFEWSFRGDAPWVFPDANALRMDTPNEVMSSGFNMTAWEGRVVLSGLVRVVATWRSLSDTAEVLLRVSPRSGPGWGDLPVVFDPLVRDIPTDSTKTFLQQPGAGQDSLLLGRNIDVQSRDSNWPLLIIDRHTVTIDSIAGGPNAGLWFVQSTGSIRSNRAVAIRTWIWGREKPKFSYTPVQELLTNRALLEARRLNDKDTLRMHLDSAELSLGVWGHEAYGRNGAKGHQGQIEIAAKSFETCGKAPPILERIVASDSMAARFWIVWVLNEATKSLAAAAWHDRVYGNRDLSPYYEVVSKTTKVNSGLTVKYLSGDPKGIPQPQFAPDSTVKCTRTYP